MVLARFRSSESGFSLVEAAISTGLMAVAALGVAQLFAFAINANLNAKGQTSTAVLAVQKMEQLRSLSWGYSEGTGGAVGVPLTDLTTDLTVDPATSGGVGLTPSPATALDTNTPGYVDYLDANGVWVGTGGTPPAGAVYIRRWAVQPLPGNPNDTLVFQVVVVSVRRELRRQSAPAGSRLLDDTRLVSVKTRKAI